MSARRQGPVAAASRGRERLRYDAHDDPDPTAVASV